LRRWAAARGVNPAYDEVGSVFVHPSPCDGPSGDGYPDELRGTPRVFRAYDGNGRTVDGRLAQPEDDPGRVLEQPLDDERVAVVPARDPGPKGQPEPYGAWARSPGGLGFVGGGGGVGRVGCGCNGSGGSGLPGSGSGSSGGSLMRAVSRSTCPSASC
jgi:hypothetical protein